MSERRLLKKQLLLWFISNLRHFPQIGQLPLERGNVNSSLGPFLQVVLGPSFSLYRQAGIIVLMLLLLLCVCGCEHHSMYVGECHSMYVGECHSMYVGVSATACM